MSPLPISQLVPTPSPSRHLEIVAGHIAQMAEEKWRSNLHTLVHLGLSSLGDLQPHNF